MTHIFMYVTEMELANKHLKHMHACVVSISVALVNLTHWPATWHLCKVYALLSVPISLFPKSDRIHTFNLHLPLG